MKLTPIDIQQQQFRRQLFGSDRQEVHAFLDLVSQQMGELSRENNELRSDLHRLEREFEEHRTREATLRDAMVTAQRAIEDVREHARKEAQLVVTEAEVRAEKIVHNAHGRVIKIQEELSQLRRQRARAIEELRGVLNTHARLLEVHDEEAREEAAESEGRVAVLERLRPPAPPACDELSLVQATG
jgi:cell division initiation protein